MKRFAIAMGVALSLGLMVFTALAAPAKPSCAVVPAVVQTQTNFIVNGDGYKAGQWLYVVVHIGSDWTEGITTQAGGNGAFTQERLAVSGHDGASSVEVFNLLSNGDKPRATCEFTVTP